MRKLNLYLWIIALVGVISSCSRDEAVGLQNEASNRVRIGTSIDEALQTRAASVTIPADHKLRYVLEVWSTVSTPACIYRDEKLTSTADAVAFDFILSEAGDYKALLWADFVSESASTTQKTSPNTYTHYADLHYKTDSDNGLKAVTLAKTGTDYVINDDARDAFFACIRIEKGTGMFEENVELTRPFGQINVIEKNTSLLAKVASMTLTYNVPEQFNVETGIPQGAAAVNPTVTTLPTATADRKANLFYDFIFTPNTAQTLVGSIKLTFTSTDSRITLPDYTIPANMPAVRNKRTNISGSILQANSNDAKLTVTVSDAWTAPDNEENLADIAQAKADLGTEESGGNDTDARNHVFHISTKEQLKAMHVLFENRVKLDGTTGNYDKYSDATYKLTNNIDLSGEDWTPIGNYNFGLQGIFDGQGYTISNMNVNVQDTGAPVRAGLFKVVMGKVSNLIVEGEVTAECSGYCYTGGICGYLDNGTIEFCRFNGTVYSSSSSSTAYNRAGGITGDAGGSNPTIIGCIAKAKVTLGNQSGRATAGGLAGYFPKTQPITYSTWNNNPDEGGTIFMIGNLSSTAEHTGTKSFVTIPGLNGFLDGINSGVPGSTYIWKAGAQNTDFPVLEPRK